MDRFLDMRELQRLSGLSRSSLYRRLRDDPLFPRPRKLGPRARRWLESEVHRWLISREVVEGKNPGGTQGEP